MAFFDQGTVLFQKLHLDQSGAKAHAFDPDRCGGVNGARAFEGAADPNLKGNGFASDPNQAQKNGRKDPQGPGAAQEWRLFGAGVGFDMRSRFWSR